ncbi:MAG: PAS domain-containing protein [Anaerolineae bacterium]|nr:PAS domain-containing protein [Anaerolineae bacterium]
MGYLLVITAITSLIGIGAALLAARWRARTRQAYAAACLSCAAGAFVALFRLAQPAAGGLLDLLQTLLFCVWSTALLSLAVLLAYAPHLARRRLPWTLYAPLAAAAVVTTAVALLWTLPGGDPYAQVYRRFVAWWIAIGSMLLLSALAVALLSSTAVRVRGGERGQIVALAALIALRALLGSAGVQLLPGTFAIAAPAVGDVLVAAGLAYAILRRAAPALGERASALLFEGVRQGVLILDRERIVLGCNARAAHLLGLAVQDIVGKQIDHALAASSLPADLWQRLSEGLEGDPVAVREERHANPDGERIVRHELAPIGSPGEPAQGYVWLLQDVSALRRYQAEATACGRALSAARQELEEGGERIRELQETLRSLTEPVVPIAEGVVAMPLAGRIDGVRAERITERLLAGIGARAAKLALLDVTGVPDIDPTVAGYLIQAARAAALMGCRPVLVGIRPEIAPAFVSSGLDRSGIVTCSDLQRGIEYALGVLDLELRRSVR